MRPSLRTGPRGRQTRAMYVDAGFNVAADAYDRFMGRYSTLLSPQMADLAGVAPGQRVLDVGCGPGALTAVLVDRVGADHVTAVDPSEPFVAAAPARFPGVDVRAALRRGAALRGRRVRRRDRAARRPLHDGPRRRAARDAARDPTRRRRRRVRLGPRRRPRARSACSGRPRAELDPAAADESDLRRRARAATSVELFEAAGPHATSRQSESSRRPRAPELRGVVGAVHRRRRAGRRRTSGGSIRLRATGCASAAASCSRAARSPSNRSPGLRGASPRSPRERSMRWPPEPIRSKMTPWNETATGARAG